MSEIVCPAMLRGSAGTVQRRCGREASRWIRALGKGATPSGADETAVEPGSAVLLDRSTADFFRDEDDSRWRWYAVLDFATKLGELARSTTPALESPVLALVEATPWGGLTLLWSDYGTLRPENMARRIRTVLEYWDALATIRYLAGIPADTLAPIVEAKTQFFREMWSDGRGGDLRTDLDEAVATMSRADPRETRERIVTSFVRIGEGAKQHLPDPFRDREWIASRVASLDENAIGQLATGVYARFHARVARWKYDEEQSGR